MNKNFIDFMQDKFVIYPLFWIYNLILLGYSFISLGLLFTSSSLYNNPLDYVIIMYMLLLLPVVSIISRFCSFLDKSPLNTLKYLFGIELPLVLFAIFRLSSVNELPTPAWFLIFATLFGLIGYFIILLHINFKRKIFDFLLLFSQIILLLVGIYACILAMFFVLPVFTFWLSLFLPMFLSFIGGIFSMRLGELIAFGIMAIIIFIMQLVVFVASFFLLITPFMGLYLYWKSFNDKYNELLNDYKDSSVNIASTVFSIIFIISIFSLSNQNNSVAYLNQLNEIRDQKSFEERQPYIKNMLKNEDSIKHALLNNYLARYIYPMDNQSNLLYDYYSNQLHLPSDTADFIQGFFNMLVSPFICQNNFDKLHTNSVKHYKEMFDTDITDGERSRIRKVMKATSQEDILQATQVDKDSKLVRMVSRVVKVKTNPDTPLAEVTVEEEYANTTNKLQEILFEFSLPLESVVTSLELGPNLEFKGVISPKGAARRTYENQIVERKDPALLEQVGPRQYRIRVFPIPQKNTPVQMFAENNQKIRYKYITFKGNNSIALPNISQKRNVFSDDKTSITYYLNNFEVYKMEDRELTSFPITKSFMDVLKPVYTEIDNYYVYFIPHKSLNTDIDKVFKNKKIALLIDASYSSKNINWNKYLNNDHSIKKLIQSNELDAYYFNIELSNKMTINNLQKLNTLGDVAHYGETDRLEALHEIPKDYDLALMLTDDNEFDQYKGYDELNSLQFPVYVVHADNKMPVYNESLSLELLKDGGNAVGSISEAMNLYAETKEKNITLPAECELMNVDRFGTWLLTPKPLTDIPINAPADNFDQDIFTTLAADNLINYLIKQSNFSNTDHLDMIHSLAKEYNVVTQFSSLIALVNDQQMNELQMAEESNDRYKVNEPVVNFNFNSGSSSNSFFENTQTANQSSNDVFSWLPGGQINNTVNRINNVLSGVNANVNTTGASTNYESSFFENNNTAPNNSGNFNEVARKYSSAASNPDFASEMTSAPGSDQNNSNAPEPDQTSSSTNNINAILPDVQSNQPQNNRSGDIDQQSSYNLYYYLLLLLLLAIVTVFFNRKQLKLILKK